MQVEHVGVDTRLEEQVLADVELPAGAEVGAGVVTGPVTVGGLGDVGGGGLVAGHDGGGQLAAVGHLHVGETQPGVDAQGAEARGGVDAALDHRHRIEAVAGAARLGQVRAAGREGEASAAEIVAADHADAGRVIGVVVRLVLPQARVELAGPEAGDDDVAFVLVVRLGGHVEAVGGGAGHRLGHADHGVEHVAARAGQQLVVVGHQGLAIGGGDDRRLDLGVLRQGRVDRIEGRRFGLVEAHLRGRLGDDVDVDGARGDVAGEAAAEQVRQAAEQVGVGRPHAQ